MTKDKIFELAISVYRYNTFGLTMQEQYDEILKASKDIGIKFTDEDEPIDDR